jgi:hypothetical protein
MVNVTLARRGRVDCLVNNAGDSLGIAGRSRVYP